MKLNLRLRNRRFESPSVTPFLACNFMSFRQAIGAHQQRRIMRRFHDRTRVKTNRSFPIRSINRRWNEACQKAKLRQSNRATTCRRQHAKKANPTTIRQCQERSITRWMFDRASKVAHKFPCGFFFNLYKRNFLLSRDAKLFHFARADKKHSDRKCRS